MCDHRFTYHSVIPPTHCPKCGKCLGCGQGFTPYTPPSYPVYPPSIPWTTPVPCPYSRITYTANNTVAHVG